VPTFDNTFKVTFGMWLLSTKFERREWRRRRDLAAKLAGKNMGERAERYVQERRAREQ
jgi:hypothetical protein